VELSAMATTSSTISSRFAPLSLNELPSQPLVSILVGNYNYASYIGQTIQSVLNQTYQNWELIVCDDGSKDGSVPIIEGYSQQESRILLLCKPNGGHTSALNAAYSACRGDIICLLDSDDLYTPEMLEKVTAAFSVSPEAGFLIHRVLRVDEQRQRQGVWPLSTSLPDGWLGPQILSEGGVLPYAPPTSGISLRRQVAEALFPLPLTPPLHICPDQVIGRLAPLISSVKRIKDTLAEYRLHGANAYSQQKITAESVQRELSLSRALREEQYRFLSQHYPETAEQIAPLEKSSHTALLQYLLAKLQNDLQARRHRDRYLAACRGRRHPGWLLFWRLSFYFPNTLFRFAMDVVLGQGALKQLLVRLKTLN
jgi:glycosyltransferase involved in cell wall biosynthesis